ncbi:iron multicopper oxidase fer1-like [Belonocnema kinseyi]|uniref:iron multicopper oxidase fer1-like n=1 Tax=Belonocnema kinseyi TaxID=2817044 RepID=UPI00143CF9C2|nr:iron multicopper oxidase fer1-like [Belonocnema kinseyi]
MGSACKFCRQNNTDQLLNVPTCQCIEADGADRTILSINRLLPGPSIQVCQGDMIIVDVENKAEGLEVILHWHGLFQKDSQYYDGVPMVTQCNIQTGDTFSIEVVRHQCMSVYNLRAMTIFVKPLYYLIDAQSLNLKPQGKGDPRFVLMPVSRRDSLDAKCQN